MKILKSKEVYFYQIHEGEVFDRHLGLKEVYDPKGLLTYSETYDLAGNVNVEESRSYKNGQLSEITVVDYLNHTEQRTEYIYDGDKITNEIEHFEGGRFVKSQISYDEKGRVEEITKLDEDSLFLGKTTFDYHHLTKEVNEYDDMNFLFSKVTSNYNERGNEVESIHIEYYDDSYPKSDREINTTVERIFDENNNLLSEEGRRGDLVFYRRKCEYDSQNNLISTEIFNHDVNYLLVLKYKYNSLNKAVEETEYRNDQKVFTKSVKYDADGHLIEESLTQTLVDGYQQVRTKEVIHTFH